MIDHRSTQGSRRPRLTPGDLEVIDEALAALDVMYAVREQAAPNIEPGAAHRRRRIVAARAKIHDIAAAKRPMGMQADLRPPPAGPDTEAIEDAGPGLGESCA